MTDIMGVLKPILGKNANGATLTFAAQFVIGLISGTVYLPVCIPSFFSFQMKIQSHQLMLDQMANFDVRAAHCTVPSDREAIEQHVKELFQRHGLNNGIQNASLVDEGELRLPKFIPLMEESGNDSLDRFNEYVRGTLREFVITQIGQELYVPWHTCLIAFLPMIFYSSVNVLGCDLLSQQVNF